MKSIGLRLFLTPDVLANLVSEVADKFKRFVRIKNAKPASDVYEVDLSILDSYNTGPLDAVDPNYRVTVTREMVGELFDLLGLFPRPEKDRHAEKVAVSAIRVRLDLIAKRAADREFVPQWVQEINYHLDSLAK